MPYDTNRTGHGRHKHVGMALDAPETPAQPDLWSTDTDHVEEHPEAVKFEKFDQANPIVLDTLIREARRWMAERPGAPLGMDLLIGRVRWVLTLKLSKIDDGFRINDHFAPAYARLVMAYAPETAGLFNVRSTAWADEYVARRIARETGQAAA